jgi:hypothetical protein
MELVADLIIFVMFSTSIFFNLPGVKRLGREDDHSPLASAEVKKMWIYTSTPHTPSWRNA